MPFITTAHLLINQKSSIWHLTNCTNSSRAVRVSSQVTKLIPHWLILHVPDVSHPSVLSTPQVSLSNWTPKRPIRSCAYPMTVWPWRRMKAPWRRVTLRSASAEPDPMVPLATSSSTVAAIIGRFYWAPPHGEWFHILSLVTILISNWVTLPIDHLLKTENDVITCQPLCCLKSFPV